MNGVQIYRKQFLYLLLEEGLLKLIDRYGGTAICIDHNHCVAVDVNNLIDPLIINELYKYLNKNVSWIIESYIEYDENRLAEYIERKEFENEFIEYSSRCLKIKGNEFYVQFQGRELYIGYLMGHGDKLSEIQARVPDFIDKLKKIGFEVKAEDFEYVVEMW